MKKSKIISFLMVILCIIGYIYYYITLPAINIHSVGFWTFIISVFSILTVVSVIWKLKGKKANLKDTSKNVFKFCGFITLGLIVIFIMGSLLSSPIVNASKYQKLLQIKEGDFNEDIEQISYNEIPILDRDSATLLGSRKMGSIVEYVSQFEVADDYTQINYQGIPVRITPLKYGSVFKWITNHRNGIPAYLRINMANQDTELIRLEEGIKYSEADHFGRNINRYIRFKYPTYIFDKLNFEIDDEGVPYYVCPVKDFKIGLFGGQTISNVVLVNAVTGETADYKIDEVPKWVDRVYRVDLLISYYNYYGTLKHGYLNSVLSQKDALKTTDGYNYIAQDDDVWVYTGVTSVGGDESNVGFVIMNQRTAETKYYPISGAEEFSGMRSAEGQVQHLGYTATFPLLLNIAGEPTYFISLKDEAGLVKKYAMVNIAKYQIVAIGDSVNECEKVYINMLKTNGITLTDTTSLPTATGKILKIAEAVIDGNSHYYVLLDNSSAIFDVLVDENIDIVKYNVGDTVTFSYTKGDSVNTVLGIR